MEFLFLLLAIIGIQSISTVVIILVVKQFFRQVVAGMGATNPYSPSIFPQKVKPFFREEKNQIPEQDPNEIEFSEDNPMSLPKNIKIEIEGGDSIAPPGYSVQ